MPSRNRREVGDITALHEACVSQHAEARVAALDDDDDDDEPECELFPSSLPWMVSEDEDGEAVIIEVSNLDYSSAALIEANCVGEVLELTKELELLDAAAEAEALVASGARPPPPLPIEVLDAVPDAKWRDWAHLAYLAAQPLVRPPCTASTA